MRRGVPIPYLARITSWCVSNQLLHIRRRWQKGRVLEWICEIRTILPPSCPLCKHELLLWRPVINGKNRFAWNRALIWHVFVFMDTNLIKKEKSIIRFFIDNLRDCWQPMIQVLTVYVNVNNSTTLGYSWPRIKNVTKRT